MSLPQTDVHSLVELNPTRLGHGVHEYSPYWPAGESSRDLSLEKIDAVNSGEDNTQLLEPVRVTRSRTYSIILPVLLLCLSALLPAFMGALFYVSLGFKARHGTFYANGTYVRPLHEGVKFGGENSFLTIHFSPLLLSSISSSLIGILSPAVMGLVAYHLASMWLHSSRSRSTVNPTPMQYYHTLDLVSNASPMAFLRVIIYAVKQGWSRWKSASLVHSRISRILLTAFLAMFAVLSLDWAIRIVDVVLHSQITSTIISTIDEHPVQFASNAVIKAGCEDPISNPCGVVNRTNEASIGGLNQSTIFRVYQYRSENLTRQQSIAFIGPVDPPSNLKFEADTIVASTHCDVYHPECYVQDESPRVCGPTLSNDMLETPELDNWNRFPWTDGFNTTDWQMRLQTFLTVKGNLTAPDAKPPYSLSSGSNMNPFTTVSFGCFPDYSDIVYSDTNMSFQTPFINWWTYGAGILNKPYLLCSVSICNTSVYDAKYTLSKGALSLDTSSFTLANATAAVAVSGAGMFLGTGDSLFYQWGPRFIDDQLQLDLSSAGNAYGNDTAQFSAAWAQAFSNRYLGWTAGMVELANHSARQSVEQLALSIPIATTYIFTILHFSYALAISALGISCLLVARGSSVQGDILAAHQRLSDTSVLVQELAQSTLDAMDEDEVLWTGKFGRGFVSESQQRLAGEGSEYVDDEVSVRLRRKTNGSLGLKFQRD